jgi:hypothetical protein
MANLESTVRRVNATTGDGDNVVVPEWVLVALPTQRHEQLRRGAR